LVTGLIEYWPYGAVQEKTIVSTLAFSLYITVAIYRWLCLQRCYADFP